MKRTNYFKFLLSLLVTVSSVVRNHGQDQAKSAETRRVHSPDKTFSIIMPVGWNKPIPIEQGSTCMLAYEGKSVFYGIGLVKVSKMTFPQKVTDLQSLARGDIDRSKDKLARFELHEESEITINQRTAYFYSYSYLMGEGKGSWMGTLSSYIISGEGSDLYGMTFTVSSSQYSKLKSVFHESAKTIIISKSK